MANGLLPRRRRPAPGDGQLADDTGMRQQPGPTPPKPTMKGPGDVGRMMPKPTFATQQRVPKPALPSRTPKPVAFDRTGGAIPGVSGRLHDLTSRASPYIQQARARADQLANRRGLRSSSIAAGAGEAAAIAAALPIAQADASIAAGERGMRSQEFMQQRGITSQEFMQARALRTQELMQQRGLSHDAAQRQADRELQQTLQAGSQAFQAEQARLGRDFAGTQAELAREAQRLMQERGISAQEARDIAQREFAGREAALDRETQRLMQERGISAQDARAQAQREFAGQQAELDRETQRIMQERGITAENARQEAARELSGRIAVSTAVQNAQDTFNRRLTAIDNNPNIGAEDRAGMIAKIERQRDDALSLIEQTHNVDLDWTTARPG